MRTLLKFLISGTVLLVSLTSMVRAAPFVLVGSCPYGCDDSPQHFYSGGVEYLQLSLIFMPSGPVPVPDFAPTPPDGSTYIYFGATGQGMGTFDPGNGDPAQVEYYSPVDPIRSYDVGFAVDTSNAGVFTPSIHVTGSWEVLWGTTTGYAYAFSAQYPFDYTFSDTMTIDPVATPVPAALPLFATGLGALGLFGWRRKRKAQVVTA